MTSGLESQSSNANETGEENIHEVQAENNSTEIEKEPIEALDEVIDENISSISYTELNACTSGQCEIKTLRIC